MFVDLDWPTNASSPLSASAELLVQIRAMRAKLMHLVESAAPFSCTFQ